MKKTTSLATARMILVGLALALCAPAWSLPIRVDAGIPPVSAKAVSERTTVWHAHALRAGMALPANMRLIHDPKKHTRQARGRATPNLMSQSAQGTQRADVLRWKWAEGQTLRYRTTQEMSWTMTGGLGGLDGGNDANNETKNEWAIIYEIKQHVTRVDADGIATVEQTYESAIINATDAQESVRYNSKNRADEKKKNHRLIKPFAAFVGKTITFRVGPEGKVHSLKGASKILDDALGATGASNPLVMGLTAMFRASLSDESMRKGLEQQLRIVPDKAVTRGETWSVSSDQSMPLVGTLVTDTTYKLDRFRRVRRAQHAMIQVTGEIKQKEAAQPPAPGGPGGLMPTLNLATLSDSAINGNIEFSVPEGRIERSSLSMSMTFKIGLGPGMEMQYKMNQRGDMELLSAR